MVRYLTLCCLVVLVSVALPGPVAASDTSPLAEAAELPLVFRRTTLIVRDIDDALALYRDALGMEVIYDEEIARPHPFEEREQRLRLIFLKASHAHVGVIGLIDYEYGYPEHPVHEKPVAREGFTPGNAVLIFNTTELESRWPDIENAPGVEIISAPKVTQYPGYGGEGTIEVLVSKFYDADGYLIELNQILSH